MVELLRCEAEAVRLVGVRTQPSLWDGALEETLH